MKGGHLRKSYEEDGHRPLIILIVINMIMFGFVIIKWTEDYLSI